MLQQESVPATPIKISAYEAEQISQIKAWKKEEPGLLNRRVATAPRSFHWVLEKLTPYKALENVFDLVNSTAQRLTDQEDVLEEAEVSALSDIQYLDLATVDALANSTHNWAVGIAAAEGAATGVTGIAGLAADIPAIITLAFRTIYKISHCYGFASEDDLEKQLVLGVLAVSGADSVQQKMDCLRQLRAIKVALLRKEHPEMPEIQSDIRLDTVSVSIKQLTRQVAMNLLKRKALQTIPALGAVVGGSINAWYIKDVGWAARRIFQERWLIENHKIDLDAPHL